MIPEKPKNRDDLIAWRLERMAERSLELNRDRERIRKLAEEDQYVRIAGESYTPVSLHKDSPLMLYGKVNSSNLEEILKMFADPSASPKPADLEGKSLPERQLQAWLIKKALLNGRSLIKALNVKDDRFKDDFDELLFGFDEISLGDANYPPIDRCDLLCVGVKSERTFPVVLELKSKSATPADVYGELARQTETYSKYLNHPNFQEKFANLLEAQTGRRLTEPIKAKKMVIVGEDDYQCARAYDARGTFRQLGITALHHYKLGSGYKFKYIEK